MGHANLMPLLWRNLKDVNADTCGMSGHYAKRQSNTGLSEGSVLTMFVMSNVLK